MENKAIELAWKGDITESQALHRALDFLKANGRDILDESDETLAEHVRFLTVDLRILHAKYQLIYTLGDPVVLDGSAMRWRVAAAVLASVARHAPKLAATWPGAMQPLGQVVAHEFPKSLRHPAHRAWQGMDMDVVASLGPCRSPSRGCRTQSEWQLLRAAQPLCC